MSNKITREGFAKIFYDSKYDVGVEVINECYRYATHSEIKPLVYEKTDKEEILSWINKEASEWEEAFRPYGKGETTLFVFIKALKEKIISLKTKSSEVPYPFYVPSEKVSVEFAEWILSNEFIKQTDGKKQWWGKDKTEETYTSLELYKMFLKSK